MRVIDNVTHLRRSAGPFKRLLVGGGSIISIGGKEYVEFFVLDKVV